MEGLNGCGAPYFELDITQNPGVASCCCYYAGPLVQWFPGISLDECWNSDAMQNIRRQLRGGGEAVLSCPGCHWFHYRDPRTSPFPPESMTVPADLNDAQRKNWKKAIEEYRARSIVVKSKPIKHFINFGMPCNIRCPMCSQGAQRKKETLTEPSLRADAATVLAWRNDLALAHRVDIVGGDPFVIPEAMKFMKEFVADDIFADVRLGIYSNGLKLPEFIDVLQNKNKLQIFISLDAVGEAHNYIREGSDWAHVTQNIEDFIERGRKNGLDWKVGVNNVVMKSALPTLPELCAWLVERGIAVGFTHLYRNEGNKEFVDGEDIFADPTLLNDIPDWRDKFTQAIAILNSDETNLEAGASLELYLRKLDGTPDEPVASNQR